MTDDLVKRLRYLSRVFRKHDVEELTYNDYLSARLYPDEAADRIEALTAEYEEAMECNEQFFVDNEFLKKRVEKAEAEAAALKAQNREMALDVLASSGQAADAYAAQLAAEAERDRLREAAIALRDDMMERAEFRMDTISGEQYRIVNAGNIAWMDFRAELKGDSQ